MQQIQYFIGILLYIHLFTCDVTVSSQKDNDTTQVLTSNIKWECNSTDKCTATDSVCTINHLCECRFGYIYNVDMTSCIKVATRLYDSCEETIQCSTYLLSGARCINNICVCAPGYYYLHGRCNRHMNLFEKCKLDIDCYVNADFEASMCNSTEGICKCNSDFYQREYRTCRPEGKNIGDNCTVDIDCTYSNMSYCNNFVCDEKNELKKSIDPSFDTVSNINEDFANQQIRVGEKCRTTTNCQILGAGTVICDDDKKCRCYRAHFPSINGTRCIPELGEYCQPNGTIGTIEQSVCRNGKWACMSDSVASADNRQCLKATIAYQGKCQKNEQCYVFGPDAVCNKDKCVCNENSHYIESELFCWMNKAFGELCQQDRDCYVKDFKGKLMCKNNKCDCPDGLHLNEKGLACLPSSELGETCEADIDCITTHAVCKKKLCVCADNYYQSDEQCLGGINSICRKNEDCTPKYSVCTYDNMLCSCESGYVPAAVDSCLPISSYGESCLADIQCSVSIPDAICTIIGESNKIATDMAKWPSAREAKICTCQKNAQYMFGRCFTKKRLGESCTNIGECYVSSHTDRVVCRNGKCSCNWNYTNSTNNTCLDPNGAVNYFVSTKLLTLALFATVIRNLHL